MRIVLKVDQFPGISETFITNKVIGLLERGIDVKVICNGFNKKLYNETDRFVQKIPKNVIIANAPLNPFYKILLNFPFIFLKTLLFYPKRSCKFMIRGWEIFGPGVFKKLYLDSSYIAANPDFIHFEFGVQADGKMYLKDLLDTKAIVSFRGFDLAYYGLSDPKTYEDVWAHADAIHILAKHQQKDAAKRGCHKGMRYFIIPPAIDILKFKPLPKTSQPTKKINILSVGRLHWVKGYEYGLLAIKKLVDQGITNFHYNIIGDGEMKDSINFFIRQYSLEDYITVKGSKQHNGIVSSLENSDIFLHPAVSEGFGNAVIEAQAMGVAVVCFDVGGLPENIIDGKTGYLAPLRNSEALGEKVKKLIENPGLRKKMGQNGIERVHGHFDIKCQNDNIALMYTSLYNEK